MKYILFILLTLGLASCIFCEDHKQVISITISRPGTPVYKDTIIVSYYKTLYIQGEHNELTDANCHKKATDVLNFSILSDVK